MRANKYVVVSASRVPSTSMKAAAGGRSKVGQLTSGLSRRGHPAPHLIGQRPRRGVVAGLGDHPDDRLGVAGTDMRPAVLPVEAEAVPAGGPPPREGRP